MNSKDLEQALQKLPHGPEFRFLDKLVSLDPGKNGIGEYRVRPDEPFLRGHFPGQPLFPGVLLVEAAAQLTGTIVQSDPALPMVPGLKLTAMRGIKIYGTAKPGEVIRVQSQILQRLGPLIQAQVSVFVDDNKIMQGEVTLSGDSPAPV